MPNMKQNLRVPGPTPVPDEVARADAQPMINHRGPEFAALIGEVLEALKPFFGTESEPLLLTGSGTGALEAGIVNVLSPGDRILSVTGGVFGDRFAAIAEAFGANVEYLRVEWGKAVTADQVTEALEGNQFKAVMLTHNETSTGVTIDLEAIAKAVRQADPNILILVDGVSSIGALPFRMDDWDLDLAITGSQKAWMSPPGMTMIGVSERAWLAHKTAKMPRFYWDFTKARKNGEKRTTPFTPAVGVMFGLQAALSMMSEEGVENIYARHRKIGQQMRDGLNDLGLELFADPAAASNTVTAVRIPGGHDSGTLIADMRSQGVVVANGQDWLKGSIFRVGHMGWVHERDIDAVLATLRVSLSRLSLEKAV